VPAPHRDTSAGCNFPRDALYSPQIIGFEPKDLAEMSTTQARPARSRPKVMTMTPAAVERVRSLMAARGGAIAGLKIGVKKGGCAGMEYTMDWVETVSRLDEVVEQDGARVIVDPEAVLFLLGTQMDWKVDRLSAQFVFNNPNQASACGCGESVNLVPVSRDRVQALES
jgi:iron-sulfur cluster assembly protein